MSVMLQECGSGFMTQNDDASQFGCRRQTWPGWRRAGRGREGVGEACTCIKDMLGLCIRVSCFGCVCGLSACPALRWVV